jgi:hypothetical protein
MAVIGGESEIATFVQLMVIEARPAAVDFAPFDLAPDRSVPPVPFSRAVRPNSDMVTSVTLSASSPRSRQNAAMLEEKSRSRFDSWPSTFGESRFDSQVGFKKLGNLLHAATEFRVGIFDARAGLV